MAARIVLALACAALAAGFALRLDDHDACRAARGVLFAGGDAVAEVREHCHDAEDLALAAQSLVAHGRRDAAADLARRATRAAPDDFSGWAALANALRGVDEEGAALAILRGRELNPRWRGAGP